MVTSECKDKCGRFMATIRKLSSTEETFLAISTIQYMFYIHVMTYI